MKMENEAPKEAVAKGVGGSDASPSSKAMEVGHRASDILNGDERAQEEELRARIRDVEERRVPWETKLGASLYDATKDDLVLREGREELYASLEELDAERAGYEAELDALRAAARARVDRERLLAQAVEDDAPFDCPFCGRHIASGDRFCAGCGRPVEEGRRELVARMLSEQYEAAEDPVCPACGSPVREGDRFCISCGAKLA